jgi:predicted nuclease of predicted toxin-antitoxin system
MKFLLDVNTSRVLGGWLEEMGHNVVWVADTDKRMKDEDILDWAVQEQRIIVTTDKDFEEMIWREHRVHYGVLRLENLPRAERRALLLYVMNCHEQHLASGAIIIALKRKIRIRRGH